MALIILFVGCKSSKDVSESFCGNSFECKQIYKNCHYSKYSAFFDETASAENVTEISDQELKT